MSIIQIPSQSVLKLGLHQSSNNALHWEKRQLTPLRAPERSKTQLNTPLGYITLISCRLAHFGVVQVHFEVLSRPILTQNFPFWLLWCSVGSQNLKVPEIFCQIFITNMIVKKNINIIKGSNSLMIIMMMMTIYSGRGSESRQEWWETDLLSSSCSKRGCPP